MFKKKKRYNAAAVTSNVAVNPKSVFTCKKINNLLIALYAGILATAITKCEGRTFQLQVFPPNFRELPPPQLELFDLDEMFSSADVRLAQLANKCTNSELISVFFQEKSSSSDVNRCLQFHSYIAETEQTLLVVAHFIFVVMLPVRLNSRAIPIYSHEQSRPPDEARRSHQFYKPIHFCYHSCSFDERPFQNK